MSKRLKIASILLYLVSALAILVGIVYLGSSRIMPYHERYLGMTHEQLAPKVGALLLILIKGAGVASLSSGITLALLVKGPFNKGDIWAWWIILALTLLSLVPVMLLSISMGLYTPWWLAAIMIIMVIVAMITSWSECSS